MLQMPMRPPQGEYDYENESPHFPAVFRFLCGLWFLLMIENFNDLAVAMLTMDLERMEMNYELHVHLYEYCVLFIVFLWLRRYINNTECFSLFVFCNVAFGQMLFFRWFFEKLLHGAIDYEFELHMQYQALLWKKEATFAAAGAMREEVEVVQVNVEVQRQPQPVQEPPAAGAATPSLYGFSYERVVPL